jgi:nucleoside 2-deoxyribosyltransferase
MNLKGRRIHIAGSADLESDPAKLQKIHELVSQLTSALAREGANFVIPFGKEPLLKDRTDGPSIIFDWTTAETVLQELKGGHAVSTGTSGRLIATVGTSKTHEQIPVTRRQVYDELRDKSAVEMRILQPGWTAGAVRRKNLADLGDILIGVSGGQGVEQLAIEYSTRGKPVIPLDIHVGASRRDGAGGAGRLFDRALAAPGDFFRVIGGESPADLLERTRTFEGETPTEKVVDAVMNLLRKLEPPHAFFVRLLNNSIPENALVEKFFRETVDTLVIELGYKPLQMGIGKNEFAWMNQAIFDSLHHSGVVIVDVTGLRPNCFMELGYALGHGQRVILTAHNATNISFDAAAIEAFQWNENDDKDERLAKFRTHWERNIDMPSLVKAREAK